MEDCSTIIVGGGIAGTSIAHHLSSMGERAGSFSWKKAALASGSSSRSDSIVERQLFTKFGIMLGVKSRCGVQNVEIIRMTRHHPVNQSRPLELFQISKPTIRSGCRGR
ncbi:MAG: hypothetical protein OK474_07000 [Thaumarchaeota archaeon]|nr:hypothetical protein [Nitrososphaerota archaeon]